MNGILTGTDDVIAKHINDGDHNFRHGIVAKKMTNAPEGFNAKLLINELIEKIESNLKAARAPKSKAILGESRENWREHSPRYGHANRKPERDLEHKLVEIARKHEGPWNWWNQMPVASGLIDFQADRTRAIDLVCKSKDDPKHYRLIELKVSRSAGGPLFALMEIVRYGLIYFVLRKNNWLDGLSDDAEIFDASQVDLCVLAPVDYYLGYDLGWLEKRLKDALDAICRKHFDMDLMMSLTSYRAMNLPKQTKVTSDEILMSYLTDWEKAYVEEGESHPPVS